MLQNKSSRYKQFIILKIRNGEKCEVKSEGHWYFLAVKELSALLKRKDF